MPNVPNSAALDACGAPAKTSALDVISNPTNPAATTVAWSSASSRAPAIHPFQRSMFRLPPGPTGFCTRMSPICSRPPGLSTRAISRSPASLSGNRFSTPLERTTSAQASSTGSDSASPLRNSTFPACISAALARARSSMAGVMSTPIT